MSGPEDRTADTLWAASLAGAFVLMLSAFIYALFSQASSATASAFSRLFLIDVDLGQCSAGFAVLNMAPIA